jgi:uncharacterized protein YjbI with pentapeptide repeats
MSKQPSPPVDWRAPRLAGKTFVLANCLNREHFVAVIKAEGGSVARDVTAKVDYVVVEDRGGSTPGAVKKAERLNQGGKADIRVLDKEGFLALLAPTREQALAMLAAGEEGVRRWQGLEELSEWMWRAIPMPHLGAVDFRKASLRGVKLHTTRVDGSDFSGADLSESLLGKQKGLKLDGAVLRDADAGELRDGTAKRAEWTGGWVGKAERVDFTGAKLDGTKLSHLSASNFPKASLRKAHLDESVVRGCDFTGADLSGADLKQSKLAGNVFTRARLEGATLEKSDLTGADLSRASLARADLAKAKLARADLRGADLRHANFFDADLCGARLDGADFTGANLIGARLDARAEKQAKGLGRAIRTAPGKKGPHLRELQALADVAKELDTVAVVEFPDARVRFHAHVNRTRTGRNLWVEWDHFSLAGHRWSIDEVRSFAGGMLAMARRWAGGKLRFDMVEVKCDRKPRGTDLWALAASTWCEALGQEVPSAEEFAELRKTFPESRKQLREGYLAELRGGPEGVARWNVRSWEHELEHLCKNFDGADLSGADLAGAKFLSLEFRSANFERADLTGSRVWWDGDFSSASFRKARLDGSDWDNGTFDGANFEGASLTGCWIRYRGFRGANLRHADLSGSELEYVHLNGADLSGANLDGVSFDGVWYDEHTRWPDGFVRPEGLRWDGTGPEPDFPGEGPAGPLDFDALLGNLRAGTDAARLEKTLAMLKAERFQLYADSDDEQLVGVVKSQSNPDLIYSCRLTRGGEYACCTQNLNVCGGLRGAPCKHILVLVLGLTKAGRLDPAVVDRWLRKGRRRGPSLDKDVMSEALLRYKGAEAGRIDWRPTETIPEDFYAL